MIYVRKKLKSEADWKIKNLFSVNFKYVEYFSILMTVLINIFVIFSIYYNQDPATATTESTLSMVYPYYGVIFTLSLLDLLSTGSLHISDVLS